MKLILSFLLILFTLNSMAKVEMPSDPTHPGNNEMGYDIEVKNINELGRKSFLYLPNRMDGTKSPVVVFGHGQALNQTHYDKTLEHLASKGIAALYVQYDKNFFDRDWRRMAKDWNTIVNATLMNFSDQLSTDQIIFSGHSKGGYIGLMAAGAPNKPALVSATLLFAPAGYDKDYLKNMDPGNAVSIFWGEKDSVISKSDNMKIYNELTVTHKQFVEVVSYDDQEADHYFPQNKSAIFGGKNGVGGFHYYGVWKWLVGAAWDLETKSNTTNPYIYGDQLSNTGVMGLEHKVQKSFPERKSYIFKPKNKNQETWFKSPKLFTSIGRNLYRVELSQEELSLARINKNFEYIVLNHEFKPLLEPNDFHRNQWWIYDDKRFDVSAFEAWDITTGSRDVVVGVVDSGINWRHSDLKNNLWVNQAEEMGEKGVDDDGNGYVDDIKGFNFATNNPNSSDTRGHGTLVSGAIGAEGNNGIGIAGMAWNVQMMSLNIFPNLFGNATLESVLKAIHYAIDNGAHIINASFGQADDDLVPAEGFKPLIEAIELAKDKGILFVAAAGNSSGNNDEKGMIPATLNVDNILSVGASNHKGEKWAKTNYGLNSVDVIAPGQEIYTTNGSSGYKYVSGTSLSAPIVSGIAALMLSVNPSLTYTDIIDLMTKSCKPAESLVELSRCGGVIDAHQAVKQAKAKL